MPLPGDDNPRPVVLVVDDEPEIRRMATLALSEAGFKAEVAEDGKSGLECFVKHRAHICLVLTDVVMPIMDGLRMVEKILELEPEMKTLFMTGYSDAQLEVLARTRFPLIRKPFLPPHLERGDPQEQLTRLEAAPGALTAPKTQ